MTKARLYQDIDGCINADMPPGWGKLDQGPVAPTHGNPPLTADYSYTIRWAPAMVERLKALDAELIWLTTWQHDAAPGVGKLIGFGEDAPYLKPLNGEVTFPTIYWKLDALLKHQSESPSPFIWIDDEIDQHEFIREAGEALGGLLISPRQFLGITPAHMEAMETYLAVVEDGALDADL